MAPEACDGRAVVVEVLEHVEGQDGVTGFDPLGERLGQVGLDQFPSRTVELLQRASRDVGADGSITSTLQRLQGPAPAAAHVQDPHGGADAEPDEQGQRQIRAAATRGAGRSSRRGPRGYPRPCCPPRCRPTSG